MEIGQGPQQDRPGQDGGGAFIGSSTGWRRDPTLGVVLILLASYAFFRHARDWNAASRLMLTYAIADRGTVRLDGLEDHTHDIARAGGHYYTDKTPGFSVLALIPYGLARLVLGLPPHPLNRRGPEIPHWAADYWVTLGTSGVLTALTAGLLVRRAGALGCGPRRAALVGLAYGLATPAYVYGTLSYGHQVAAFALFASFELLAAPGGRHAGLRAAAAGFLASFAAVVELQVGPVAAILGLYLLAQVAGRFRPVVDLVWFGLGALVPALVLLGYNAIAFGSPWDLGYFHLITPQFARIHHAGNPIGLVGPRWGPIGALLWGRYRGLLFYAPILFLAVPGWVVLASRRAWGLALVPAAVAVVVVAINASYPAWDGGWSTGPRLLLPLLPFAMVPVAAALGAGGRGATGLAGVLTLAGAVVMLLFQGVGGRIPDAIHDPLVEAVWPLWRGDRVPRWATGGRFDRTLVSWLAPRDVAWLPASLQWLQFVPLVAFQLVAIGLLLRWCRAVDPG